MNHQEFNFLRKKKSKQYKMNPLSVTSVVVVMSLIAIVVYNYYNDGKFSIPTTTQLGLAVGTGAFAGVATFFMKKNGTQTVETLEPPLVSSPPPASLDSMSA